MPQSTGELSNLAQTGNEQTNANYLIDSVKPQTVMRPETREEIASLLASAEESDLVVVPQSGRTALTLGRPLERYDVALDLSGLNHIIAYEPDDLTVSVEAGVRLGELSTILAEHGQYLPIDAPPSDDISIGGLLATGRSGAWRGHLPAARDLILGITIALPGSLVRSGGRVVKNVSGYDLHRLQTGALGAFGVIVEASFKLATLPSSTRSFAVPANDITASAEFALELRDRALPLRALSVLAPEAAAQVDLPEYAHTLLECTGTSETLERCATIVGSNATEPPPKAWERLRALAGENENVILRLGVPATGLARTIETARALGTTCWGHLAAGSVLATKSMLDAADVQALRTYAIAQGGFLQIEAGPANLRTEIDPFGQGEVALVQALQREFDPKQIINRGRWNGES